jgi:UDP-2,4-diacetamido-2,4,6-trideoxy-beta-L-altropyranose hydrolase
MQQGGLLIRADASRQIGTGHIMRCLALAQGWQASGGSAQFVAATLPAALDARLRDERLDLAYLNAPSGGAADAAQTSELARQMRAAWIVADGYQFGGAYQRALKATGFPLLLIDDYGHADHYCADLVLNQNMYAHESLYPSREPYTRMLLGPPYALLRREFWLWRGRPREVASRSTRVLVTLGGSDQDNVTLDVIQALRQLRRPDLEARIVVGPANTHLAALRRAIGGSIVQIDLLSAGTDMPALMAWADLAISAAGSTCWELAFMGVPSVTIILADNQQGIAESLGQAGAGINMGWHTHLSGRALAELVGELLEQPNARRQMSDRGRSLVDGWGVERVVRLLRATRSLTAEIR